MRDGIFSISSDLFGVRFKRVAGAPVWHESVETYDVYDDGQRLGRFYLDLHPRPGKFNHAAAFPLVVGLRGVQRPRLQLPGPEDDEGARPPGA